LTIFLLEISFQFKQNGNIPEQPFLASSMSVPPVWRKTCSYVQTFWRKL